MTGFETIIYYGLVIPFGCIITATLIALSLYLCCEFWSFLIDQILHNVSCFKARLWLDRAEKDRIMRVAIAEGRSSERVKDSIRIG